MNKMVFEVPQKNGALIHPRIGSSHHSQDTHIGLAEWAIGGTLFLLAAGFVLFLLTL